MTQDTENSSQFRDAKYATAARTNVMLIDNSYLEYRVAVKMPDETWNVTKVDIKPTDVENEYSVGIKTTKSGQIFVKAMQELADFEKVADSLENWNIITNISADKVPGSFQETEHFTPVCEREGVAFGKNGRPHTFYGDHIVTDGTFKLSELNSCHETVKTQHEDKLDRVVRKGALSEIFANQGNDNTGNLDSKMNAFKAMGRMDKFMKSLSIFEQTMHDLTQDPEAQDYIEDQVYTCESLLDDCKAVGVHTAPFSKLIAECEITSYMISAQTIMHNIINNDNYGNEERLETAQDLVAQASKKYISRGGSQEGIDRIKHAITKSDKITVPKEISTIIERYQKRKAETQAALKNEISGNAKPATAAPTPTPKQG